jgi:hypothetical protein
MDGERRGFAGFESLVTDLSDLPPLPPPPPPRPDDKAPAGPVSKPGPIDGRSRPPRHTRAMRIGGTAAILVALLAIVVGIPWLENLSTHNRPAPVAPRPKGVTYAPQPGVPYAPQPGIPYNPSMTPFSAPIPQTNRFQPSPYAEEKPPAGQDIALSTAQLRYCLAQGARLDGSEKAADKTSQSQITRFNALVDDYNARCVQYRYRASEMQTLKAEVDARRALLEREGALLIRLPGSR